MPRKKNSRAASGAGSIRQRKNGKWEARYTVGTDPNTGKTIRKSIYGDTQKEVQQKLNAMQANLQSEKHFEPSKMTLAEYLENIWLKDRMSSKKYSTVKTYTAIIRNHIIPALGHKKISEITPYDIQKFCNRLAVDGHKVARLDEDGHIIKKDGEIV